MMQNTATQDTEYSHGLCGTCRSAPGCTFQRRAGVPVIECLEFDGESRAVGKPPARSRPHEHGQTGTREPGLCGWCDIRASCTFPRNAGGVWSCEEYQ